MKTDQLYKIFRDESTGIATDTRTLKEGQIFFALWGQNFNGNQFAGEAIGKGASCAVIDDPAYESDKTLLVDDCLIELQSLALHHRKQMKATVLAITGTNGKTTTKELITTIMSKKLKVHSTKGNFNNEIGLPLTILSAPDDTEMLILEMGANHIGEIRTLCNIARPDIGIITNIGTAHLEGFGSFEGVVKAKSELYEFLKKVNGIAIYDDKNPLLTEKIYKLVNRAVPYSDPTGVMLSVEPAESEMNLGVRVTYHHQTHFIQTNLFGIYNLENVKAAIATGLFLGAGIDEIKDAVSNYQPGNNRSQLKKTDNNSLICDSYNANPTSMMLAIKSFAGIKNPNKVIILGDMLELGEKSEEEHAGILNILKCAAPCEVILVGNMFSKVSAGSDIKSFRDVEKLRSHLSENPIRGSYILIKGSRKMTLEKIYDLL